MFKNFLLLLALVATTSFAQDEVYMENQAGGYLALTHEECKSEKVRDRFPFHAYGIEAGRAEPHLACYDIPKLPTREEANIPEGMSLIAVVNLIDLADGEVHMLQANWFTATKPGQEETF